MTPVWILDTFAALMLAVAAVSLTRLTMAWAAAAPLRRPGPASLGIDAAHLLMAVAMAGMLAPGLTVAPDTAWAAVFGLMTAWFAWQLRRDAHANGIRALAGGRCAPHLVHGAAMLYMYLARTAPAAVPGMNGMTGTGGSGMRTLQYPTLAFVFTVILAGYSVWDLDWLSGGRPGLAGIGAPLAPAGLPAPPGAGATAFAMPPVTGSPAAAKVPAGPGAGEATAAGGTPAGVSAFRSLLLSRGMTVGCRVVMGVSMAFMLAVML